MVGLVPMGISPLLRVLPCKEPDGRGVIQYPRI